MNKDTPYIGCEVALISAAQIRYTGILDSTHLEDRTITLKHVRSHGTEKRRCTVAVGPSKDMYEFIVFRGLDICDL